MPKRMFSVTELHEADTGNQLHRTLDARALVLLGIGAIIGTGIFVLTGTAAANHAGPALVLSFLIACLFPVTILGELVSIGTLLAFTTVCIGVLVLRHTRPDIPRPFRVPAPWFVCIAGALVCLGMMVSLPHDTWVRLAGWTALGLLIYFGYGFRHSELRKAGR